MSIALAGLLSGTITDLKTREVPDWINFSLIFSGFGIATIRSVVSWDISYILYSVLGFGLLFIVAYVMYYTGQWGGGDSKMVMGLGSLIGLSIPLSIAEPPFIILFIIYSIVAGAAYGLIWSIVVAIRCWDRFKKDLFSRMKKKEIKLVKVVLIILAIGALVLSLFLTAAAKIIVLITVMLLILTLYLFVFIKAVENVCMIKKLEPSELTPGDWIAEPVISKTEEGEGLLSATVKKRRETIVRKRENSFFYELLHEIDDRYRCNPMLGRLAILYDRYNKKTERLISKVTKETVLEDLSKRLGMREACLEKILKAKNRKKIASPEELENIRQALLQEKVSFEGEYIAGPADLGIEEHQIEKIKSLGKSVKVKEGIPFVPSFLIAFLLGLIFKGELLLFFF